MECFTTAEMADMHLAYGAANGNGRAAVRLYRERFPNRRVPNHQTFARLHRQLRETGTFHANMQDTGRERTMRTPDMEEEILRRIEDNPCTSTRAVARSLGVNHALVWRVLHEQQLHPFHRQRVQALQPQDYPLRVEFVRWFLQQTAVQPDFPAHVLFSDEASFTREGVFNVHNSHVWAHENPHATRTGGHQQRFAVHVWAGIVHDMLIGPYLLPPRLNGRIYRIFLEETLPELLEDVPVDIRRRMWFQHDGAPAHFSNDVRDYLNATFGNRWIGRGGPVAWPPRSPDLTCIDFFLWGHMKNLVYETTIDSDEDLVARIAVAAATVREMPGIFQNVRQSMLRRCHACNTVAGRTFEHLL